MRKRKTKVIGTIAAAVLVFLLFGSLLTRKPVDDPQSNGHPLSYWIETYGAQWYDTDTGIASDTPELEDATNAISQLGTNALPLLLKWLPYDSPFWARPLHWIPSALGGEKLVARVEQNTIVRGAMASACFRLLGTNAEPAIPALTVMMRDTSRPIVATRAIFALGSIGKPTFPLLTQALSDIHQPEREHIINAIAVYMPRAVGTSACLPSLLAGLTDSDPSVRRRATNALNFLAPQTITNLGARAALAPSEATNASPK